MANDRFYFISHADGLVHNINDFEHQIVDNGTGAYIGEDCGEDCFRVDMEVQLWTIHEIVEFYK